MTIHDDQHCALDDDEAQLPIVATTPSYRQAEMMHLHAVAGEECAGRIWDCMAAMSPDGAVAYALTEPADEQQEVPRFGASVIQEYVLAADDWRYASA